MGVTAESAVTPTVIVAHHALSPAVIDSAVNNLFRRKKKGHEWPNLKIISASKAENKKRWCKSVAYGECSELLSGTCHLPASASLKRGPG